MPRGKKKESLVPDYREFVNPTFHVIKELGGSASNRQIHDAIVTMMNLPEEAVNEQHTNKNESELIYRLRWVRTWMKKVGIINNKARATWSIESKYKKVNTLDDSTVDLVMSAKQKNKIPDDVIDDIRFEDVIDSSPDGTPWREDLRNILPKMNGYGFEILCTKILECCQISDVQVTKRSRDKGIDGFGKIVINKLFSKTIAFQCKCYKYDNNIRANQIRDFRGAIEGNADMGVFITTSDYTSDAIEEAKRMPTKEIHLLNGEDIIDLLLEYAIGVEAKTWYKVDAEYFLNME